MHIAEGVLSGPVLAGGAILAATGVVIGLRRLSPEQSVLCGVMSAAFFVGSLIHVPVGFANAHLILNGLTGVLLGWAAFPAILVALALQALLFQYGGLTTLGVNAFTMGAAAVASWKVFCWIYKLFPGPWGLKAAAFAGGALGVFFSAFLTALALAFSDEGFQAAAAALFVAHLPVMAVEGFITMFTVGFIAKVKPDMLLLNIPGKQIQRNAA